MKPLKSELPLRMPLLLTMETYPVLTSFVVKRRINWATSKATNDPNHSLSLSSAVHQKPTRNNKVRRGHPEQRSYFVVE
jgi:hypothetical protein